MDANPYAAPRTSLEPAPGDSASVPEWTFADVFDEMKRMVVRHWAVVFLLAPVVFALKMGFNQAVMGQFVDGEGLKAIGKQKDLQAILSAFTHWMIPMLGATVVTMVFGAILESVLIKVYSAALHDERIDGALLLRGLSRSVMCFLAMAASALLGMVGVVLCFVPGIIAILALSWAPYFAVDQDVGPIEALKGSWKITRDPGWYRVVGVFVAVMVLATASGLLMGVSVFASWGAQAVSTVIADLSLNIVYGLASGRLVPKRLVEEPLVAQSV